VHRLDTPLPGAMEFGVLIGTTRVAQEWPCASNPCPRPPLAPADPALVAGPAVWASRPTGDPAGLDHPQSVVLPVGRQILPARRNVLEHGAGLIGEVVVADRLVTTRGIEGLVDVAPGDAPGGIDHLEVVEIELRVQLPVVRRHPRRVQFCRRESGSLGDRELAVEDREQPLLLLGTPDAVDPI